MTPIPSEHDGLVETVLHPNDKRAVTIAITTLSLSVDPAVGGLDRPTPRMQKCVIDFVLVRN